MPSANDTAKNTVGVPGIADHIQSTEEVLRALQQEVDSIGGPAAQGLRERLDALIIEENALKRNAEESEKMSPRRREQIERLLQHIEQEQASLAEDTAFLNQAAPSTASLAAEAGQRLFELVSGSLRKILNDHQPLGESVFVNKTHEDLVDQHGLDQNG